MSGANEPLQLPASWQWQTLKQVSQRVSVGFVGPTSEFFCEPKNGVRLVRSQNIRPGQLKLEDTAWVTAGFHQTNAKSQIILGDVLITRVGANAGDVCRVPDINEPLHLSSAVFARPKPGFSRFVELWLRSPVGQQLLKATIVGSVSERINTRDAERIAVPIPPFEEMTAIADLLGSLDDKIELNRRVNETLERIAQAIFRDWFVDFGPTRRKIDGATDPVEIMGGLVADSNRARELADLFPARLGDDGLPEGWRQSTASDLIEFNPKQPLKKGEVAPYSDMSSLPTSGPLAEEPVQREFGSGMRFRNGDALLARITPCLENGKAAFVDFLPDKQPVGWGSTEFFVLRSKVGVPSPFAYLLVRLSEFRAVAISSMTGTSGRQRAQVDRLEAFPMACPDGAVLVAFGTFVEPMFDKISANGRENRTLAATRDLLLPKLMSGEIRLRDAEREIEAVA